MALLNFVAERKGAEPQRFPNPYDALAALVGTDGTADVYLDRGGERSHLLHRDEHGSWEAVH